MNLDNAPVFLKVDCLRLQSDLEQIWVYGLVVEGGQILCRRIAVRKDRIRESEDWETDWWNTVLKDALDIVVVKWVFYAWNV